MESSPFTGLWHITESPDFAVSNLNLEVQAYIRIDQDGNGEFQFILVHGWITPRTSRKQKVTPESEFNFSWSGNDECDEASGRGKLILLDQKTLQCEISFNDGDDYEFTAIKVSPEL